MLTVAVLVGAAYTVKHTNRVAEAAPAVLRPTVTSGATPDATPNATADSSSSSSPSPRVTVSAAANRDVVVLAGPDLLGIRGQLAKATGDTVDTVDGAPPEVLAPSALDAVSATPDAVVLQVQAGSRTTARTTAAIVAVTNKWPKARVLVVGPFSSNDRMSAAAANTAAQAAHVTFLDPVLLHWRTNDTTATLTARDVRAVTARLATALS